MTKHQPDEAEPARVGGAAARPSPAQHRELGNAPRGAGRGHQEPWECQQPGLGQFKKHSSRNIKLTHSSSMSRGGCSQAAEPCSRGELQDRAVSRLVNRPVRLLLLFWPRTSAPDTGAGGESVPDLSWATWTLARPSEQVPGSSAPLPGPAGEKVTQEAVATPVAESPG